MKKILIMAVALTISISSFSQKKEVDSKIIIAGNLKNYDAHEVHVWTGKSDPTAPIEAGAFKLSFNAEEANTYYLWVVPSPTVREQSNPDKKEKISMRHKFYLFLSPGDSIYLSADFNDYIEGFKVTGDHAAENTYLFEKRVFGNLDELSGLIDWWPYMNLDKDRLFSKKDSLFSAAKFRFELLKTNHNIDPAFVKLEEAYFQYEPLVFDLNYSVMKVQHLNELPKLGGLYVPFARKDSLAIIMLIEKWIGSNIIYKMREDSKDFPITKINDELAKVDLGRIDLISSVPYTSLINTRINDATREIMKQDSTIKKNNAGYKKAWEMAINELLTNQKVKDYYRYNSIKPNLDYRGPAYVKAEYDKFMKDNQSPKLAAQLKESHDKWNPILPGTEVPDFSFFNINGESVKLSELRGTLVYIDIWATWCGPCIAAHPHWDKLREEYKDMSISFVTISIDDNKASWEKMVKAKGMQGLQWYAPGTELVQHFMANAIPRYILIDREGKIIDPIADGPSGNIRAMLDKHL
jgi:thiol-disulfide isomerase/thioredoxin